MFRKPRQSGFTLIELLIVVALLSLVAGWIIPSANPSFRDQLEGAAGVLATDIAFARSLAVSNDSNYRITFDVPNNQYVLSHVGANPAFNTLPRSPYAQSGDPSDKHIVRLANLPQLGNSVRLFAVRTLATTPQSVSDLEIGPFGETTRSEETQIWLASGSDNATRYLSIRVNAVTGLTFIENFQASDPLAPTGGSGS